MKNPQSPILRECIETFAKQLAEAMQGKEVVIRQSIEQRLVGEQTPERRKLLSAIEERIGKHWSGFCATLADALVNKALARAGYIEDDDSDVALNVSSLRLIDDDQMDWDLSLGGVGGRLHSGGGKILTQIESRIAGLLKKQLDDDDFHNPLGPETLVVALKKAIDVVSPETDSRRVLLLIVEPVFTECVNLQYEDANNLLVDSGVEGVSRPKFISGGGRTDAGGNGHGHAAGGPGDMAALLQQMVQKAGGGMPMGGGGGGGGGGGSMAAGMVAVPAGLLESLNRLQSLDLSALQSGAFADSAAGNVNVLRELRQQESVRNLPPIEAVTIDIVATLFDFIFDDAMVPDSIKALVGRLQIPLLKVAMIDKTFFSNKEHPARALLNDISRVSIASGATLVIGNPVFERIKAVINRVLNEFEQDQAIFAALLPEMQAMVAEQEQKAIQVAEQSKKVAEDQEQHELAELRAGEAFSRILEQGMSDEVPSHIGDFLSRRYPLVLKRALLNGGVQGPAWTLATQTLSDLLWTLLPKPTPEDRQRMVGLLPDLLRRVHAFFDKVGVSPEEKSAFIDALAAHHSIIIKGVRKPDKKKDDVRKDADKKPGTAEGKPADFIPPASEVVSSGSMAPLVVVTRVVQENGIEVESMTVAGKASNSRTVRSIEVSGLQRGDWVEFDHEDGFVLRARLSWVSPYRGVMLFTNPESSKAVSINQEALAIKIKAGQARILGDDTMVDRAMGKTIESLKAA